MRYLFYNSCNATPHLETELEIAKTLMDEGHEIFFLVCNGNLSSCFLNAEHNRHLCSVCISQGMRGIQALNIDDSNIISLGLANSVAIPIPPAFANISELKAFQYDGIDIGLGVASSIVSAVRDHNFDTTKLQDKINGGIRSSIMVYESSKKVLEDLRPDGVYIFNGRFLEARPLLRACEKMNITYFTHERGGQVDRYMLRKNSTPHALSTTKVEIASMWEMGGEEKHQLGRKFFEDRRNKVVQAWSVFTEAQKEGRLPATFDRAKTNIAIFNTSMDEYEGIVDFNNKIYKDDNEGIRKICESFSSATNFHIYLRVHPNLRGLKNSQNAEIEKMAKEFSNLTVISPEDDIDTYALMEASNAVVTFGSTMGIEAVYWRKPSVLLGRAFYEDLRGLYRPESHEETVALLGGPLQPILNDEAVKYGYWCLNFGLRFKYFVPDGLFTGKFEGRRIKASLLSRIKYRIVKRFGN